MFIENFLLVFGCVCLSVGFVLYSTDDLVESKLLGAKYTKKNYNYWFNKPCIIVSSLIFYFGGKRG